MKPVAIRFTAALLALAASPARADDTHYQDFVLGGRALGLAGAFAAIADDASGLYFNPAGIVDSESSSLQFSTTLYGFERSAISAGQSLTLPVPGIESLDVQFTDLLVIPASGGAVHGFGALAPDGRFRHAYGLSVAVPSFRSYRTTSGGNPEVADDPATTNLIEQTPSYSRRVIDRSLWTSAGYAYRPTPALRLGVSLHYVLRSVVDLEEVALAATVKDTDQQVFRLATNDVSLLHGSFVVIAGAKYTHDGWSAGVALQAPSVALHAQSQLRFSRAESIPAVAADASTSRLQSDVIANATTESRLGALLRAGVSYRRPFRYTLSVDAAVHAPVSYRLVRADPSALSRLAFNPEVQRDAVVNVNVGGEYLVIHEVSISGGFFTDYSSAPRIAEGLSQVDHLPHVNLTGLTLGLGYYTEHTISRLGVLYSFGTGFDSIPDSDIGRVLEQQQRFRRVEIFQSFFYVFLSSSFRY